MSPTLATREVPHLDKTSCKPNPARPMTNKKTIIQAKNLFILDFISVTKANFQITLAPGVNTGLIRLFKSK